MTDSAEAAPKLDPASRLVILRHGQTDHNLAGRLQGQVDVPLNAKGREQAAIAARSLDETSQRPAVIVSSPLSRALETAQIIARRLGMESDVEVDPGLLEAGFGRWEGLTDAEIKDGWPEEHARWRAHELIQEMGLEERGVVGRRVAEACLRILEKHPGERVLVVSHGAAARSGITELIGLDASTFHGIAGLGNCCSSVLEPMRSDPRGRLLRLQSHNRPADFTVPG